MNTQQESDSIGDAIDALMTLTDQFGSRLESEISELNRGTLTPTDRSVLSMLRRLVPILRKQKDILVLLDSKLYEIEKRSP